LLNSSLQLTRRTAAGATERMAVSQRFRRSCAFIGRVFMGLDWTVTSTVDAWRRQKAHSRCGCRCWLGESVLTPGLEVGDEGVLVSMPSGESMVSWESALERVDRGCAGRPRRATSPGSSSGTSSSADVARQFAGTPAILPTEDSAGLWINQFLPRGETLDLTVVRPAATQATPWRSTASSHDPLR
jgi:hypothetical protein